MLKREVNKYKDKLVNQVTTGERGSVYKYLRKLGNLSSNQGSSGFIIESHKNLSPLQSAECIASFFAKISQEYSPLDFKNLPNKIREHLSADTSNIFADTVPVISDFQVNLKMKRAKKTNSAVKGDIPPKTD